MDTIDLAQQVPVALDATSMEVLCCYEHPTKGRITWPVKVRAATAASAGWMSAMQAAKLANAATLEGGRVPLDQLPPGVLSEIVEVASFGALPAPADANRNNIYFVKDSGAIYRWSGSAWVNMRDVGEINIGSVVGLQIALNGKANQADLTALQDVVEGKIDADDPRLTNARTPTAHAATHQPGGSDEITPAMLGAATAEQGELADSAVQPDELTAALASKADASALNALAGIVGDNADAVTSLQTAVANKVADDDPRLTNARTPTAHATSHASGGADEITPEAIGAADRDHTHTIGDVDGLRGELDALAGGTGANGLTLGETSTTAYRGDRGKAAYDHSQTTGNPHGTTFASLPDAPTLGSAAQEDAEAFATAAQGAKADSAVQPAALTTAMASKADLVDGKVPAAQLPPSSGGSGASEAIVIWPDRMESVGMLDLGTWTAVSSGTTQVFYSVAYGNGAWIAVGNSGTILRSSDAGLTWSAVTSGLSENLHGVAYGDGSWIAVSESGTILRSSDAGLNWTAVSSGLSTGLHGVAYGNGAWIAVGNSGTILRSTGAGLNWTAVSSDTTQTIWGAAYGNGSWIAVGNSGTILRSSDAGLTWSAVTSGTTQSLSGAAYGNGSWIAVGVSGTILRSSDAGLNWTAVSSTISENLVGVAYGNGAWIAVGVSGTILRSSDAGLTWSAVTSGTTQSLRAAVANIVWVAVGYNGTIVRSGLNDSALYDAAAAAYLFDPSAWGGVIADILLPHGWDSTAGKVTLLWRHPTTQASAAVQWQVRAALAGDGAALTDPDGAVVDALDTGGTGGANYISPQVSITPNSADAAMLRLEVSREPTDPADTLPEDAQLAAIILYPRG